MFPGERARSRASAEVCVGSPTSSRISARVEPISFEIALSPRCAFQNSEAMPREGRSVLAGGRR